MASDTLKITLKVLRLGESEVTIADCDPNWKFYEFLQLKGNLLDASFNPGQHTFRQSLFGISKKTKKQVCFHYKERLFTLGDHFEENSILRMVRFPKYSSILINNAYSEGSGNIDECIICLHDIPGWTPDVDSFRLECGHAFHATCLSEVVDLHDYRCCICRKTISTYERESLKFRCTTLRKRETSREARQAAADGSVQAGQAAASRNVESCMLQNHDQPHFTLASNMLKSLTIIERTLDSAL